MASYFDEHDCSGGQQPDATLYLARLLLDTGMAQQFNIEFERIFNRERPPAASKAVIESLPRRAVVSDDQTQQCPVCINYFDCGQSDAAVMVDLPCKHKFHDSCIVPWLSKANSCPVCRFELATDDVDYEEYRRQQARTKQRDAELELLHNSMFT